MVSLFALLKSLDTNRVDVNVQCHDLSGTMRVDSVEDDTFMQSVASFVQLDGGIVESEQHLIESSAQLNGKKLVGSDWRNLITEVGQVFSSVEEFRKSLMDFLWKVVLITFL